MKRSRPPSWREKVSPEVAAYIDDYQNSRKPLALLKSAFESLLTGDGDIAAKLTAVDVLMPSATENCANANSPHEAEGREITILSLSREDVDQLSAIRLDFLHKLHEGDNFLQAGFVDAVENIRLIAGTLENAEQRAALYVLFAVLFKIVKGFFLRLRFQQYGVDPLDIAKKRVLAAMSLEFLAGLCRGKLDVPKGRLNTEIIELVNLIEDSQNKPLTPKELHEAIVAAGLYGGDAEDFRVWLHRMKKKGVIGKNGRDKNAPTSIEVPLKSDGRIDFDSMTAAEKVALRKLVLSNPSFFMGS